VSEWREAVEAGALRAEEQLREHGDAWLEAALTRARSGVDVLPEVSRRPALSGLVALGVARPALARAGIGWGVELLARYGHGELTPEARAAIFSAPYEQRRATLHAATDAAHADYLARAEARAAVLAALLAAGQAAAKAALPLLLAAL
jgi:hypothetical protein